MIEEKSHPLILIAIIEFDPVNNPLKLQSLTTLTYPDKSTYFNDVQSSNI